jgi:hypothetical protein
METGEMTQSAMNAASARAAHLIFDAEPKIMRDDYARELVINPFGRILIDSLPVAWL